jgi:hypothetical protein
MDNSYDKKTIYTFSIIGAHLVEIFYIHLYNEGEKLKISKTAKTQTEGYKFAVHSFISSMNKNSKKYKPKFYNELLIGLTEYFAKYTDKPSLKLKGCVDMVVTEFVPSAYFQSASNEQRRFLFDKILNNGIKKLTEFIFGEFLSNVIDDHDNQDNVEKLKEYMIEIFSNERQNLYSELLVGVSSRQSTETMAINNYRTEIKKLKAELLDANKMITELTTICTERANGLKKAMTACRGLLMKCNGKDDEIKLLNEKLERKQRELLDKEENTFASIQPNRYFNPSRREADQVSNYKQTDQVSNYKQTDQVSNYKQTDRQTDQEPNYYEQHNSDDEVVLISKDIPVKEPSKNIKTPLQKPNTIKTPMQKPETIKTPMQKPETIKTPMQKVDTKVSDNSTIKVSDNSTIKGSSENSNNKLQERIEENSEEENDNDDEPEKPTQKSSSEENTKEKTKELNYNDLSDIEIEDNIDTMPSISSFVSDEVVEAPKETKKNKKPKSKQEKPRTSSQMLERARYNIGNAPNLLDDY